MYSFVFKRQPKSYNSGFKSKSAKENYSNELNKSIKRFNTLTNPYKEDLYGLIYYFHKKKTGTIDADNLSKPIWDILGGILFEDDQQIKLRIAGAIDISSGDFNIIDFSRLRGEIISELIEAFENEDHIVYIECGLLNNNMYKFNIGIHGN